MADGQLVAGRVTGDLCLRQQRALSLFTLLLKETAGAPPTLRLQNMFLGFYLGNKGYCFIIRYPVLDKPDLMATIAFWSKSALNDLFQQFIEGFGLCHFIEVF